MVPEKESFPERERAKETALASKFLHQKDQEYSSGLEPVDTPPRDPASAGPILRPAACAVLVGGSRPSMSGDYLIRF